MEPEIERSAADVLALHGMTIAETCSLLLCRIAETGSLPQEFSPEPNELTRLKLEKVERGEDLHQDLHQAKDAKDLMRQLRS